MDKRKAFEKWAADNNFVLIRDHRFEDCYDSHETHAAWLAWDAAPMALALLERERCLKAVAESAWRHEGDDGYSKAMDDAAVQQLQSSYAAIRAQPPLDVAGVVGEAAKRIWDHRHSRP